MLEFGNELRRRAVLAITRRDHGRGALVPRIDLVQSLVQPRRTGDGQRREEGDDDSNADEGARLHAAGDLVNARNCASFSNPRISGI